MPVDFLATSRAYGHHLVPIWHALRDRTGTFWAHATAVPSLVAAGVPLDRIRRSRPRTRPLTVVAAYSDLVALRGAAAVLVNHGAGQTYDGDERSARCYGYSGGTGRESVRLFLGPGDADAARSAEAYPAAQSIAVGAPHLDWWHADPPARVVKDRPVVAISFHWPCAICPEAGWAWPHYMDAITALVARSGEMGWEVVGHGHPRAWVRLERWWRSIGVRTIERFDDVLREADVYACDNSSTLYEAAACGVPVVCMNAPQYRRDVDHGLRFWSHVPGLQVDRGDDLADVIALALTDPPEAQQLRERASVHVYRYRDGQCARRAADAIVSIAGE